MSEEAKEQAREKMISCPACDGMGMRVPLFPLPRLGARAVFETCEFCLGKGAFPAAAFVKLSMT